MRWSWAMLVLAACSERAQLDAGVTDAGSDAAPPCDAGPPMDAGIVRTTEVREACADRNPLRNLYFGDLHVHTSLSFDSWALGNRATPEDVRLIIKARIKTLPLRQWDVGREFRRRIAATFAERGIVMQVRTPPAR